MGKRIDTYPTKINLSITINVLAPCRECGVKKVNGIKYLEVEFLLNSGFRVVLGLQHLSLCDHGL